MALGGLVAPIVLVDPEALVGPEALHLPASSISLTVPVFRMILFDQVAWNGSAARIDPVDLAASVGLVAPTLPSDPAVPVASLGSMAAIA